MYNSTEFIEKISSQKLKMLNTLEKNLIFVFDTESIHSRMLVQSVLKDILFFFTDSKSFTICYSNNIEVVYNYSFLRLLVVLNKKHPFSEEHITQIIELLHSIRNQFGDDVESTISVDDLTSLLRDVTL